MIQKNSRTVPALWVFAGLSAAMIVFIFIRSFQPAPNSNEESLTLTAWIRSILDPKNRFTMSEWNNIIRKVAHFVEFTVLGVCVGGFTGHLGIWRGQRYCSLPLLICLLTAAVDETIQKFVPGRGSSGADVILDFCGSLFGVTCISLILFLARKKKRSC